MKSTLDLSVIIVNYNVQYFLEQCILSVKAASKQLGVEIIVVDNNSTDDSCSMLRNKFPDVVLIQNSENVGFSKANNQGVEKAKGAYVLILNPDTVVAENTFAKILNFAKSKQNLGIVGVKLVDGTGQYLPESKRGIPTPSVSFSKLFGLSGKNTGKYYANHLGENESGVVDVLVGAFMLLKRSVYVEVNGFDEDYFMYGEDIDLSYKVLKKGYQNFYFSETTVIHYKGESTRKDLKYLRYFHNAMKIFYRKHFQLNTVYDFVMNIGIEFWFLLKFFKFYKYSESRQQIKNVLFVGNNPLIEKYLKEKYLLVKKEVNPNQLQLLESIKNNKIEAVLFDNDNFANEQIIELLEKLNGENLYFKIHPKNANFLIGSNCSKNRGGVELLDNI